MSIRKGQPSDIDTVISIKDSVVKLMKESGNNQWNDSYPSRDVLLNDIKNDHLFVYEEDDTVLGCIVAVDNHVIAYDAIHWELALLVINAFHRVDVDSNSQGKVVVSVFLV